MNSFCAVCYHGMFETLHSSFLHYNKLALKSLIRQGKYTVIYVKICLKKEQLQPKTFYLLRFNVVKSISGV